PVLRRDGPRRRKPRALVRRRALDVPDHLAARHRRGRRRRVDLDSRSIAPRGEVARKIRSSEPEKRIHMSHGEGQMAGGTRRKLASFLVVDVLVVTGFLSAFALTQDCSTTIHTTGSIIYNSHPATDTIVKTLANISGGVLTSDQKLGLRIRNHLSVSNIS